MESQRIENSGKIIGEIEYDMSRHLNPFDTDESCQKIKIVNGVEIRPSNVPIDQ